MTKHKNGELNANENLAPNKNKKSKYHKVAKVFVSFGKLFFTIVLVLNVLGPIIIFLWPSFVSHIIFQHFIHIPFKNLSNPLDFGLENTHPFRLNHDNFMIGAWHILPQNSKIIPSDSITEHFKINIPKINKDTGEQTILILYLHGNTNDRSTAHRLGLYNLLSSFGHHVFAFDYRGYGDSTGEPSEESVVKDSLFIYDFLQTNIPWAKIYLWGHSLGTGISSKMARILTEQNRPAIGMILEAPFYNIVEEVELHPFTLLFPYNPILFKLLENSLNSEMLEFRSDIHLTKVKSKIAIWHAEDDLVIPIFQSVKLYEIALKNGISENITYHRVPWYHNCGHRNIYTFENITHFIKTFIV